MSDWIQLPFLCRIAAAAIFCFGPATAAFAEILVSLSPNDEWLKVTGVPFLNEDIHEAVSPESGLRLAANQPFAWSALASDNTSFPVTAHVSREAFDHAVLTIWNWQNHPIGQWQIAGGNEERFVFQLESRGTYLLTLDGYRGKECAARLVRSFAVTGDLKQLREVWKDDEFFLGVCTFPGRYHWTIAGSATLPAGITEADARELEASLMDRLGFQVVRTDESMEMGDRVTLDGPYRFQFDRMDAAVDAYTSRGFSLALQLMNAPDWATTSEYRDVDSSLWRYPKQEEPQRAYTRSLVERYGQSARLVQIFNEPDQVDFWSATPQEYLHHFRFSRKEVRNVLPETPVVNGGLSLADPERSEFLIRELGEELPLVAYHSHGYLAELKEDHETILRMHRDAGLPEPKVINTEMGVDGWRLDQERRKGEILPQKVLYCWASGHTGALLFGSRMTLGPNRVSQDFGFLDHWFCPRFVYGSMAALVETLGGATFEKVISEQDGVYIYQFSRGEDTIVAAFSTAEKQVVSFRKSGSDFSLVDPMGNQTPIQPGGNDTISLSLNGYPIYLFGRGELAYDSP
ncbi:hypothetical protein N9E25_06445 [Verrucomicrobiales bacterium]|nr:hypothetical protein [Verrucomicrobiales bacterium]